LAADAHAHQRRVPEQAVLEWFEELLEW